VATTLNALQPRCRRPRGCAASKDAAAATLDLAKKQFQAGYVNYLGLLSAEQAYQQAVINVAQAQGNRYTDNRRIVSGARWWMVEPLGCPQHNRKQYRRGCQCEIFAEPCMRGCTATSVRGGLRGVGGTGSEKSLLRSFRLATIRE